MVHPAEAPLPTADNEQVDQIPHAYIYIYIYIPSFPSCPSCPSLPSRATNERAPLRLFTSSDRFIGGRSFHEEAVTSIFTVRETVIGSDGAYPETLFQFTVESNTPASRK
jgi:hypothetical protein